MSAFKYTSTFLRSALVNDPFSLGAIGPEDVLRMESQFPDLFESPSREDPPRKITRSSAGLAASQRSLDQQQATNANNIRHSPSPKTVRPPTSIRSASPRREIFSANPRPSPYTGERYESCSVCSRGDRCSPTYIYSRPPRIPVRHLNKFPLRKGPLPKREEPTNSVQPNRPSSANTDGSLEARTIPSLKQVCTIGQGIPSPTLRNVHAYASQRKSDSELLKMRRHLQQSKSSRSRLRNSPYRSKVVILHSIEKPGKRTHSPPLVSVLQKPSLIPHSPLHMLGEIRNLGRIQEQRLKQFQSKLNSRRTKTQKPESDEQGMKTATVALNGSVDVRIPLNRASDSDNDSVASSCPSCAELSRRLCQECMLLEQRQAQAQGPIDSCEAEAKTAKFSPEPERSSQNKAEVRELNQLLLARILASRYEKAGHMLKNRDEMSQKTSSRSSIQNPLRQERTTQPEGKLVEQLMQELIREEILKCIHMEADEMLKNQAADDTESDSEANFAPVSQNMNDNLGKLETDTKSNTKLSVIDEESINLVTPELTPPEARYQYQRQASVHIQKPVHDYENDEDIEEIRTPEITPVSTNGKVADRKDGKNGKTAKNNGHDVTDCSSFSDFILSDNEKMQAPPEPAKRASEVEIENVSTPSKTSLALRQTTERSVDDYASMSTPLKSASHEEQKGMAHANKKVQTEATPRSKRSRSKSKQSLSAILSGLDISAAKSTSEHFETTNDGLSEGEFLQTLYKSNGEISLSSLTSPGLYISGMNGGADDDITDYENLDSILEVDTPTDDDTLSEGEAPMSLSTTLLLEKVERLLNELN